MTASLDTADRARLARSRLRPMAVDDGLALFDACCASGSGQLVPMSLDVDGMRSAARRGELPALYRGLVRAPARRVVTAVDTGPSLADRIAALPDGDRAAHVVALVRSHAATVLGHVGVDAVDVEAAFSDLGFDSLTSVELRNRLSTATGLSLPSSLVFDHPTPATLGAYVLARIRPADRPPLSDELDRLESAFSEASEASEDLAPIAARLSKLLSAWQRTQGASDDVASRLSAASRDEVLAFITDELGVS
jgi:acyl carrier protein